MINRFLFVALVSMTSIFTVGCGGGAASNDDKHDLAICNPPDDYECADGECPDATGCNWCSCSAAFGFGEWNCNMRACGEPNGDGGTTGGCTSDAQCGSGKVCRFLGGCGDGICFGPTDTFLQGCQWTSSKELTACLCDGTSGQITVDCRGADERFKNYGACK